MGRVSNKIFVVEMRRWGEDETHHYIIGAFTSKEEAEIAGDIERTYRGSKYEPFIEELPILESHLQCATKGMIEYWEACK